jgi:myo-inositol-1(or 4)-monophosphatase
MDKLTKKYLDFAEKLVKKGGKMLRRDFGKLKPGQIESKGVHDIVTSADKEVEDMYREEIKKQFPDHGIIGEEGTSIGTDREFLWIFDPLDGTKNFSTENPFFCTMICLLKNKEPVVSAIYAPITDDLYHAVKGKGAFKNGSPIHVSSVDSIKKSMLFYCHAADEESIKNAERYVVRLKILSRDAARLRCAGLEMALVAKGLCEAYLMNKLPLWDMAAGSLLVREAGGKVTDFSGKLWQPGDSNILVSNGSKIHEEILNIIK